MSETVDDMVGAQSPDDLAAMSPETYVNPVANAAFRSTLSLPRRAIESAATYQQTGQYDPAPIVEAATLPLGTGAIAGVPMRAGEMALGSGALRARYDAALAEGKITPAEHQGFIEALGPQIPTGLAERFSGKQPYIADIIRESGLSKEQVHQWLLEEAKAGRVTLHHATSVTPNPAINEAEMRIAGFKEPFVNAYFKPQPALRPVDHDPFAGTQKLVPVDHDPFAGNR